MGSKVFGPTDSVADTLTQVGSNFQVSPGPKTLYAIRVSKGNVVNAKECAGIIQITTVERDYFFAYGNGMGGATNSHSGHAEEITCAIHIPSNTILKVYVLDATAAKDVTVSCQYREGGKPNNYRTLCAGGISGSGDTAADTEESMTASTKLSRATLTPENAGKIYQIRFAGAGVVDAKAHACKIEIVVPKESGPFEYAVGRGPGGATLGGHEDADVINIPEGIPVRPDSTITVKITSAEIVKSPVITLHYW